jgi:nucleoside-diphosphate-sugar epimerase
VQCSLDDAASLAEASGQVSAVVYCAGSVRGRTLDDFLPANVEGVRSVVNALQTIGSSAPILLISSLAASRPELSSYARSKYLGEMVLREQSASPWTIFRPPAVYGPGDKEMRGVLKLARRGLVIRPGPKDQRVSLLFADDLASAVSAWLKSWSQCINQTYAIDDGHPDGYDWAGIVGAAGNARFREFGIPGPLLGAVARINYLASALLGYAPMLSPGKARELTQTDWLCDNTAFIQATGWQPQVGLPSGIRLSFE